MNYVLLTVWEFVFIIAGATLFSILVGFWAGRLQGKIDAAIERIKKENENQKTTN